MGSKHAYYRVGLNDFKYCASLCVHHPNIDPQQISGVLGLDADRSHRVGDPRQTPLGSPLTGTYDSSYWHTHLDVLDGESLEVSLEAIAKLVAPHGHLLRDIVDEGGRVELFVGIFADRLCDFVMPHRLLGELAQLRIDLRLDYYGPSPKDTQPSI